MSSRPRPFFSLQRLVISVLLAGAIVTLVVAFTLHEEEEPVRFRHEAIVDVAPDPGDTLSLRQTEVAVQLKTGYVLDALQIQNRAVGGDDLDQVVGLNRWSFTPGEGKSIERLDPGRTCALAEFHNVTAAEDPQTFSWCFSLH